MKSFTLSEAQQKLRDNWHKGIECECCGQFVKLYRRSINSTMARMIIKLYHLDKNEPRAYHISEITGSKMGSGGDFAKLRYWGLIQDVKNEDETKRTSGYWEITQPGRFFVQNALDVPKYAEVYNQKMQGLDGELVSIRQCLGNHFDYSELMGFGI